MHSSRSAVVARQPGKGGTPVIALENVVKRFGTVSAVDGVSAELRAGEFFSLLGPSGCGKTTVLRLIAGFETPSAGRICIDGGDVSALPPYRRSVNTVFQHYALFPHLTVYDNVAYGPRAQGVAADAVRRRVSDMLEITRLGELGGRRPSQLSGGQQQRVALARALVNMPRALLLDEPLSALDRNLRQAMQRELKRIQREVGITFVFVTHDQEEALGMSDRLAVMRGGRLEQLGTPEIVYETPATVFVAGFIGSGNLLPATVATVRDGYAMLRIADTASIETRTGDSFAAGSAAVVVLRPERVRLAPASPEPPLTGIPVAVTDLTFQGAVIRVALRHAAGLELAAEIPAEARPDGLDRGAPCWAVWDQRAGHVLAADSV